MLVKECVKCGRCLAVCPIYKVTGHERFSPRGKLNLIELYQTKSLTASSLFQETLNACLLCGQCEKRCVLNLPVREIIYRLRQNFWHHQKKHFLSSWLVDNILASRGITWRLIALIQQFFHLPFHLAKKPFLPKNVKTLNDNTNNTIGIFVGCVANFIYPDLAEKLFILLRKLGYNVHIPDNQVCCGLMAYTLGDKKTALKLAEKNISAFQNNKIKFIITPCASCYHHLTTFSLYRKANLQVIELSHFLLEHNIDFIPLAETITWHDPCHLYYHHQIWKEPRELLQKYYSFLESSPEGMCCGHGGSFSLNFPKLSQKILKKRIEAIKKVRAKYVVTSCMGCLIQLKSALGENYVKHILELLA